MVQTRNGDRKSYTNTSPTPECPDNSSECAKRWTDALNPALDRIVRELQSQKQKRCPMLLLTFKFDLQDELLLQAVNEHGKVWTVLTYFPCRTSQ